MDLKETRKILAVVSEAYPTFLKGRSIDGSARIWQEIFQNVPYEEVSQALITFISTDTKGFAPMPGALREIILSRREAEEMSEFEAWQLTLRAISRGCYNSREEFEKLPEPVRRVVGSPAAIHEWAMMDSGQVLTNVAAQFQRAYRNRMAWERRSDLLPKSIIEGFLPQATNPGGE